MRLYWTSALAIFIPLLSSHAIAEDWVRDTFSSIGAPYNAEQHSIPQGAAGYNYTVNQPAAVHQPAPVQQQQYQYNAGGYQVHQTQPIQLNRQLSTNIGYLQPPPPPPPQPVYVAPRTFAAPVTGFNRRR
jgi:hypothetical protein